MFEEKQGSLNKTRYVPQTYLTPLPLYIHLFNSNAHLSPYFYLKKNFKSTNGMKYSTTVEKRERERIYDYIGHTFYT